MHALEFKRAAVPGYDDVAYAGVRGDTVVELFAGHGYDDDDDMPFGSHPFMVRFRNTDRDVDAARTALGQAYTKLEAMGRYSMFATYDLQYRLELRLGS